MVSWSREGRVVLETTQVLGLTVLRAQIPSGGRWEKQRLGRAARLMSRQGVRRVLVPRNFAGWDVLARWELTGVDVLPLYRALADRLVLAELERRGVDLQRACVALRGDAVDGEMARAARLLCPRVLALDIQVKRGGEQLTRELYRQFGAAPRHVGTADLSVYFGGTGQEGALVLCGPAPELLGLELDVPGLTIPEETQPMPLLAALWRAGRVKEEQVRICF